MNAGEVAVPAGKALKELREPASAFTGALFPSLTSGTAVSTISLLSWIIFHRFKNELLYLFTLWSLITLTVILSGECIFTAAYTFVIPAVQFSILHRWAKSDIKIDIDGDADKHKKIEEKPIRDGVALFLIFIISFIFTSATYIEKCDKSIFIRVRDNLLLSGNIGESLNNFYYRNTLYASEVIRKDKESQEEITDTADRGQSETLTDSGRSHDTHRFMRLLCILGLLIALPIMLYLLCFITILNSIRLSSAYLTSLIFRRFKSIKMLPGTDTWLFAVITGLLTTSLFIYPLLTLYPLNSVKGKITIEEALNHSDCRIRIEGLRMLCRSETEKKKPWSIKKGCIDDKISSLSAGDNGNTIWSHKKAIKRALDGNAAEKYWLSNALGISENIDALPLLQKLSHDNSINVQCSAIEAICRICIAELKRYETILSAETKGNYKEDGRNPDPAELSPPVKNERGIIEAIATLQDKIEESPEWYVQKRAFQSLKRIEKQILR